MARTSGSALRVLLVEPTLDDDGALRVSLDRARRWRQAGARVTVFVVHHSPAEQQAAVPDGVVLRRATSRPHRFRWTALVGGLRVLRLAQRADVVVAGREINMGLLFAAAAARLRRRPLAVTVQSRPDTALQEYVDDRLRAVTVRALRRADLAVCVSADLVPPLVALGVPEARTRVVTNGVDVPAIRRSAAADPDIALPAGPLVVASGRLHRQKGFDVLVRAHARALHEGAPEHCLVVLGEGDDREALRQLASELQVAQSVVFPGFLPNPHAVVARSSLFVLPSRWEGYPLALVEALCLGIPVVATDCVAGPREVLDGGRYGRLVGVEDDAALAAAMSEHLRDPAPLRASARAAAAVAGDRFDPAAAADRHLGLLHELVASRSGRWPRSATAPSRRLEGAPPRR